MPTVSIIIVNWNGKAYLDECFQSLSRQRYQDFEVVFVDNASADGSVAEAKRLAAGFGLPFKLIELSSNTGFTGGNIEGLKHCTGDYIALLNNDTVVAGQWLESLVAAMGKDPAVGICASKLIVAGTDIIDSAGDCLGSSLKAYKRGEGQPAALYQEEEYVFGACAGAALYRKAMLDRIGFLDEDFFLLFEDADLNFRAQLSGWKCLFVPEAVVYHKVSPSIRKLGEAATVCAVRNDKAMVIKNAPLSLLLSQLPLFLFDELLISLPYHIRIGRFGSYLRGNVDFLKKLPVLLQKRKKVMKLRTVPARYLKEQLTDVWPIFKKKLRAKMKTLLNLSKQKQAQ